MRLFSHILNLMFRERLREAIRTSGYVVKEVAHLAGVNKRTIDKWLGNESVEPRLFDAVKVAKVLGVSVEYLVDGTEQNMLILNSDEIQLLETLKKLTDKDKIIVQELIQIIHSHY